LNEKILKGVGFKARRGLGYTEERKLQNNLKDFVNICVGKAVELCKEEPLFWDNFWNLKYEEIISVN